jgi:hypothetical protein
MDQYVHLQTATLIQSKVIYPPSFHAAAMVVVV